MSRFAFTGRRAFVRFIVLDASPPDTLAAKTRSWSKHDDHARRPHARFLPDPAATATLTAERVLILDFSSQATQPRMRLLKIVGSITENATLPFRCRV